MGILNHFFNSTRKSANKIEIDLKTIEEVWTEYLSTIERKHQLINSLTLENINLKEKLKEIKKLLTLDLLNVETDEETQHKLLLELKDLNYNDKLEEIKKFYDALGFIPSVHEHVFQLLKKLFEILTFQINIITQLLKNIEEKLQSNENLNLISNLSRQLELEKEILEQINSIEQSVKLKKFHEYFHELITQEIILENMRSRGDIFKKRLDKIFSGEISSGLTTLWISEVLHAFEGKVNEFVRNTPCVESHTELDFEFVNSEKFIELVKECSLKIKDEDGNLRNKEVSNRLVSVFVNEFRKWFNFSRN